MNTTVATPPGASLVEQQRGLEIINRTALILISLALVYVAITSVQSWFTEKSVYLENLSSIAEIEARAIDVYFKRIQLDLSGLSEELNTESGPVNLSHAFDRLQRFKALHPEFYNVTLLAPDGEVLVSANTAPKSVNATVKNESSFQTSVSELNSGAPVSLGQPFASVLTGKMMVPVRNAIRAPDGQLRYLVSANLPHEYLRTFWLETPIAKRAAIGLLRDDGFLLSRYPVPANVAVDEIYKQPRTGALIRHLRENKFPSSGSVEGESSLDGPARLTVFRRLPSFPVTLFVALPLTEVWSAWWREMWKTYLQTLILFALGLAAYRYAIKQHQLWNQQTAAANDALRESDARWQFALEGAGEGVWDWDLVTNKVTVSRLYKDIFGESLPHNSKEMDDWTARLHPDDVAAARKKFQMLISGEDDHYVDEHRERCSDGTWKWVQIRGRVASCDEAGKPTRVIGTIYDITERRAYDEQLRLLETSVSHTNDFVLITEAEPVDNPGPRIVFVNDAFVKRTGYSRDEVIGKSPRILQGPLTDREVLDRVRAALLAWRPVREEIINYTKSGEPFWVEMQISPIANESGRYTHWVAIERDITDRKRVEEALLASEHRFRIAIEALQEGFVLQNRNSEILVANKSAERILGLTADQMMGRTSLDPRWRAIREDGSAFASDAHPALVTLRDGTAQSNVVMGIEKPDGARSWIAINTAPIFDAGDPIPTGVVATFSDISDVVTAGEERRGLEQQLREAQKMESLGTLAGGIAHDFNNILGAILGNVSLATEDAADNLHVQLSLNEIGKAAGRAKSLVDQILTFSRRQTQDLTAQPLTPLIQEAVSLLRATIPAKVSLEAKIASPNAIVRCNASQISQVLLNLCTNSWHALPNGEGDIVVSLSELRIRRDSPVPGLNIAPGSYALLSVADNGSGMDEATKARIFEPFFTTKAVGAGTGLGLSVVHGIVKAHGGHIFVTSRVGEGTQFDIYLPAVAGSAGQIAASQTAQQVVEGNGRHVVYIDDDEAMVTLTVRILEKRGFRASGFLSAARALDAIREHPEDIDLVVTDYNMPGQSGLDVVRAVKRIRAEIPLIITSGYITEELRAAALNAGIRDLVYKPNTVEELVQAIVRSL